MADQNIASLESKLTFLERTVGELSQVVYDQQKTIERLESACGRLTEQLKNLTDKLPGDDLTDEKPPHY